MHAPGVRAPAGPGTLERLQAPSEAARSGVTLGGKSFGAGTETGRVSPQAVAIFPNRGHFVVVVPAASAALLTLPR